MSTLRQDRTNGQWVILAPQRAARRHEPLTSTRGPEIEFDPTCPFCPGNEDQTPPEILRDPAEWTVRVVPNLFGVLTEGPLERPGPGWFREMPGVGSHEVVIETRTHNARMGDMSPTEVSRVVSAWRTRYRSLIERPEVRAVVVFKNFGRLAGTSLEHPHSQIVATPVFLPRLLRRLDVAIRHFDSYHTCVYDELLSAELDAAERIVHQNASFVAFAPFASASAYETWILPLRHDSSFARLRDEEVADLADALIQVAARLFVACDDPDWNLVVYSAPEDGHEAFHWHVKVIPRLTTQAGFEMGSAMGINTVAPEDAAAELRAAGRS
jgi:UDPglucose--hexose-1-phosphate uridylyltransferase